MAGSYSPKSSDELMVTFKGAKYGALVGFIATWSISSAIAISEIILHLQISTFYSIMGISLGLNNVTTAAYLGFGLHLLTGTVLGAALGVIGIRWKKIRMLNPYIGSLVGIGAGLAIWLVLFLPITVVLVQSSIQRIAVISTVTSQQIMLSENIGHSITNITRMAIVFHVIWGAIFGFIMSSLLRIRELKIKQH